MLNLRSGWGAVAVLALLLVQSVARPYSGLSHFALGSALGAATLAGWVAFSDRFPPLNHGIWLLAAGATLWATGFDILYSLRASAREGSGLGHYQGPMALPLEQVIRVGRFIQVGAVLLFTTAVVMQDLGPISYLGPSVATVLLMASHHGLPRDGFHPASLRFMACQLAIGPVLFLGVLLSR
jgi:4-hydroxybenzoate polyprenyltransferase